MPTTMYLINTATVTAGGTTSMTFSSIPQTYTDLKIIVSARNAQNNYGGYQVRINGATSNNSLRTVKASGTSVSSSSRSDVIDVCSLPISGDDSNAFSCDEIYIPDYTSTARNKSFSADSTREFNDSTNNSLRMSAALQSNTAAVTSVVITLDTDTFLTGSKAYLYGIKNS
jgi:hypothetical protein